LNESHYKTLDKFLVDRAVWPIGEKWAWCMHGKTSEKTKKYYQALTLREDFEGQLIAAIQIQIQSLLGA